MTDAVPSSPVTLRSRLALTPIQRALYSSQRRSPQSPTQNMVLVTHVDGALDPDRLADAFAQVVAASDVLRTRIETSPDGEFTVSLATDPAVTEVIAVDRADAWKWSAERAAVVVPLHERAHDSALLVHEDGTCSWYLALHHCVTDAVSTTLVIRRTAEVYDGPAVDVDSYYGWAGLDADRPELVGAARHWRERPQAPKVGHLYERNRPPTAAAQRVPVELDGGLDQEFDGLVADRFRALSVDLAWSATLLTATAVLLHRVTGADRFAIGLPVHNRSRPDARDLIGPLVEVYPVDVEVETGDTFAELHRRVARSLNRTLRYAVPGAAPPGIDVEAVVNVIPSVDVTSFAGNDAHVEWVHPGAIDPGHLLRVQLSRFGGADEPLLALDVNAAAAPPGGAGRAARHLRAILAAMAADPDRSIGSFPLAGGAEARAIEVWGEGPPAPRHEPVHTIDRLRDALDVAGHVALVDGDRAWTGRELWGEVVDLAARLRASGVRPGDRVAIEMERSAEAVLSILSTMAAGASYVPIDPAQPEVRRNRLVERAGCVLRLRDIDADVPAASPPSDRPNGVPSALDGEAYLLFTSGSTGEPKGVPITHRGLAGYLDFATSAYVRAGEPPVVPLFSALTFDLTVTSVFLPLLTGGRCVVVRGDGPEAVGRIAAMPELTWCKATPSHLELLVRALPPDHALSTLVVGGESFATALARRLRRALPGVTVFNEYGPTEAVVGCMIHRWEPDAHPASPDVPIGRPAPGVALRVVDAHDQPVPIGAVGELLISSAGLTAGYLGGDGDAESFVEADGRRWYRSGDLVRMLDDETLVYLRRTDEQLKVGGIRLDPSEIEAALEEHPAIRRAAVRSWSPQHAAPARTCVRCGLADNVPGVTYDGDGVCDRCHTYDGVRAQAEAWFRRPDDLLELRDRARSERTGDHDCIALLSGGKDSTYALFQLVAMGFDVYALTLDNGFISDEAKANVARSVEALAIDHEFATTDAMAAIFRDSLERHSNVCHGCFKTIYTLGTNRAVELGAPLVVTGLSRGQLFETRLIPAQFDERRFDPDAIDAAVVAARRAYHRVDDAVKRLLDTSVFETDGPDDVFGRVTYVDFYRYVDVDLTEMLRYLDQEAPWVRPSDTGRSTNCRINAAGIHTHQLEQGYHNYAEPYAWDVRLGHKQRDEALAELDDRDDAGEVAAMLAEVGYSPHRREVLTAWVETDGGDVEVRPAELRAHLHALLPAHAVPSAFVTVDELPMTTNGKLATERLPAPERTHRPGPAIIAEPTTGVERSIVELWERRLGIDSISVDDDFFALGGDSLAALEMALALGDELGLDVPEAVAFANATPRTLAAAIVELGAAPGDAADRSDPEPGSGGDPPQRSAGERAMLFEHRRRPTDPRYNQGRLYRVDGAVDPDRVRAALAAVVADHQPLHWTFGEPRRALGPDEAIHFESGSVADDAAAAGEARVLHRRPFDLDRGPLVRCGVWSIADGSTAIALATHHASADAGSFDVMWRELAAAYHGDPMSPPEVGYADHAIWQAGRLDDADAAFWRESVGPVPSLALHSDGDEPDGLRERTAAIGADELRSAAGGAPFATVLAALASVVSRASDSDVVTLGALVSTIDHPVADRLVGYQLNTLPITVDVGSTATLRELRSACAASFGRALEHRAYPFAEMVADHRRSGRPDPTPQVLVAMQDVGSVSFGALAATREILYTGSSVADATFFVQFRDGAVVLAVEHRGSVVGAEAADRLLAALDEGLEAAVRRPTEAVGEAGVDTTASASVLTGPPAPAGRHVVESMADQAAHRPDEPAVRCGATELTWSELDLRSADLARRLVAAGVRRGDRVVVHLERSVELVVAIVGVLRAGAAYVPIDPSYPDARNRTIAASAGAVAVVSASGTDDLGIGVPGLGVTPTDAVPAEGAGSDDDLPAPDLDGPAYVIFTSGSTGTPRGVEVSHRNLAISTAARDVEYPNAPGSFLVVSSPAFDSSVAGLFWALTTGGTVVLPTEAEVHDVDALVDLAAGVTHTLLVPSLYRGMLRRADPESSWPDQIIVAGEACGADVVAAHRAARPTSRLANEYGPTEATVWSTVAHLEGRDATSPTVPIGRPIAGAWTAVVDRHGRPVPPGVVGELIVGGAIVTGGYDGIESDRFLPSSPLGPGAVFRTGDRAAVSGGELYFHGRTDDQLNVGGARIEPSEIERVYDAADGVEAAVVVARDVRPIEERMAAADPDVLARAMRQSADAADPAGALSLALDDPSRATLVAHVEGSAGLDVGALRAAVAAALPAASRPTTVKVHRRLPRLPNGKIDRAAVAALAIEPVGATATAAAAVVERSGDDDGQVDEMVALFAAVLGRDDLGPDSDFFDEGGDSLLALELFHRIEERTGLRPRVSVLFESRTPRALASSLGRVASADDAGDRALVLRSGDGVTTPLWLWPGADGVLLIFERLVAHLDGELGVYGVEYPGTRGERPPFESVEAIGEYCHAAVLATQPTGPYRMAGYSLGGLVAVDVARRLLADGREVEYVGAIESGLAGVSDPRSRAAKLAEVYRERGVVAAARRAGSSLRVMASETSGAIRRSAEGRAVAGLGLRPSDRLLFLRMEHELRAAGLRYDPAPIDAPIDVYLGEDTSGPWATSMEREWGRIAGRGLRVTTVAGSHVENTMMLEPFASSIAGAIATDLGRRR